MAEVRISDVVVPEIFTPYMQRLTEEKSRIIQSGAAVRNGAYDAALAGGGRTFNEPAWNDLDSSDATGAENVGSDDPAVTATPQNLGSHRDIQVRLSRNNHWKTMDLSQALAGSDPMAAIAGRVAAYWVRRSQRAMVESMNGLFADNDAAPTGGDTHTIGDLTNDITGVFSAGVTDFSAEALIDTAVTAGDSLEDFTLLMVHSIVYAKMRKNNLIDFFRDSDNDTRIARFGDLEVIVDDGMPVTANDYDSWLFGPGAVQIGMGTPRVPTEVDREPLQGNGAGAEQLSSRLEWIIHPAGHAFIGTPASDGGPTNTELAAATSWSRRTPERKQVKIARLRTTEA
jgi:hypothetical protein